MAFLNRVLHIKPYKSKLFVLAIGNTQMGGTGKTPLTLELITQLQDKNFNPIVISKSYKASLTAPKEVSVYDKALEVGDEPLMIKRLKPSVRVFSGPIKVKTLRFAEKSVDHNKKSLFILDDGIQHHKIKKDLKVLVFDGTRSFFDLFAFPLGFSRECLFLTEFSDFIFLNRDHQSLLSKTLKFLYKTKIKTLNYEIQSIEGFNKQKLEQKLEQRVEQNLEQEVEQNLEQEVEQNLEQGVEQNLEQEVEQNLEQGVEQNLEQEVEQNLEQGAEQNLEQRVEQNLEQRVEQNPVLVSGVGNFKHLKGKVEKFLKTQNLSLKGEIKGADHDSFNNIKLNPQEIYICTEKDHDKLKSKLNEKNLYVVKSAFDETSKTNISELVEMVEKTKW